LNRKEKARKPYYVPGKTIALKEAESSNINPLSTELTSQVKSLSVELAPQVKSLSVESNSVSLELLEIPAELKKELETLGKRVSQAKIKHLILKLCEIKPRKLAEIAFFLKRNANYIREVYLIPLIEAGNLKYTFPHQPNHPQQAYKLILTHKSKTSNS
jgi:ATP-dependent DNA helicase RecG